MCILPSIYLSAINIQIFIFHHTGFSPNLKNLENQQMLSISFPGLNCLGFAQKVQKSWNFNTKPGKHLKFLNLVFTNTLHIHVCHIYINYQHKHCDLKSIDLGRHCIRVPGNNLDRTWIFLSPEKWEP